MDIEKRTRAELKSYFLKNSIPTEKNFADLVDGMINQKDDGLVKLPGEPLSLQASGDRSSLKKVINFYEDFASSKPAWTLSLNPRLKPADQATAKPGWNLSDGDGTSRLFIARSTGYVGVGTVNPLTELDVAGLVRIGGAERKSISFARDDSDDANAGTIAYKASWASTTLSILGAGPKATRKISLYDDVSIIGGLTIAKEVKIDGGLTVAKEVKIDGGLTVAKEVKIDGGLTIAKEVKINGGLTIAKEVKIDGGLTIAKEVKIDGGLTVAKEVKIDGGLTIAKEVKIDGGLTIAKEVKIDGGLTIAKEVKIDGGLTVKKNLEIGDLKITVATGMLNVGGMVQIGASKKISFTRDTDDEANAGTIAYKPATESDALSIMGAGKEKKRKIVLRDEVVVGGGLEILKESNPLQFTKVWTEYPDEKANLRAEISNDTTGYQTLMIVGNRSAGLKTVDGSEARRVSVWDRLDVHGEFFEKLTIIKCLGSNKWENADHPLRKYFKERLKDQPKGTILHAMGDHPDWKDAYWVGMVGNDGLLRMAYTRHQEIKVIAIT